MGLEKGVETTFFCFQVTSTRGNSQQKKKST